MTNSAKSTSTNKSFSTTVTIKKVSFRPNPKGKIIPIITFHGNDDLKKRGVDSVIFDSIVIPLKFGLLGKGAKYSVTYDENLVPTFNRKMREGSKAILPTECPCCGTSIMLETQSKELVCPNLYCSGISRGGLYKLLKLSNPSATLSDFTVFLSRFALGQEGIARIDNMYEFQLAMNDVKAKNTQGRINQWIKLHDDIVGQKLWDIEVNTWNYLKNKEMSSAEFWHICNFPTITEQQFFNISQVSPKAFMNGETSFKTAYDKMTKKERSYLEQNFDFIQLLYKFTDGENKTWTK